MIGPGGERLVRFACIALDLHDYIGRSGLGAVMGAKKLKAIAVNGNTRPEVDNKQALTEIARWKRDNNEASLGTMTELVTAGGAPRELDGGAHTDLFTMDDTHAEPAGYLAATQTPDGVVHLISSALHYRFNLAWLRTPMPAGNE